MVDYVIVMGVELCNGLFCVEFVCELLEVKKFCKIEIGVLVKGGKLKLIEGSVDVV